MSLIQPTRRSLIGALVAGPAIVRVASIMPVRAAPLEDYRALQSVMRDSREYLEIKYKGEDGLIHSCFVSAL